MQTDIAVIDAASHSDHSDTDDLQLLSAEDACRLLGGMNRATLYRGVQDGRFPKPIKIAPNKARWVRSELLAVIRQRIADRDAGR